MKIHVATGNSAKEIRKYLKEVHGVEEGHDIFFLAQALAFLIHTTSADKLSVLLKHQGNRFALRKLRACLDLLDKVFSL